MTNKRTEKQKNVVDLGKLGERRVKEWLEDRGFKILEYTKKAHAGPYDIKAKRGRDTMVVEVKTGDNPSIKILNFKKMLKEECNVIGLALVMDPESEKDCMVHLLEYRKQTAAANKAWNTMRRR